MLRALGWAAVALGGMATLVLLLYANDHVPCSLYLSTASSLCTAHICFSPAMGAQEHLDCKEAERSPQAPLQQQLGLETGWKPSPHHQLQADRWLRGPSCGKQRGGLVPPPSTALKSTHRLCRSSWKDPCETCVMKNLSDMANYSIYHQAWTYSWELTSENRFAPKYLSPMAEICSCHLMSPIFLLSWVTEVWVYLEL